MKDHCVRRYTFVLVLVGIVVPTAVFAAWVQQTNGIRVEVVNNGPDPLSEIVVHVTGNYLHIGDLEVGESRTVRVLPVSESHLEISFVDQAGQSHRLDAGGYFEPGYRGVIAVELVNFAIKRNEHQIQLGRF